MWNIRYHSWFHLIFHYMYIVILILLEFFKFNLQYN